MAQEKRTPFEITADPDPFYSESNVRYLEKKMEETRGRVCDIMTSQRTI